MCTHIARFKRNSSTAPDRGDKGVNLRLFFCALAASAHAQLLLSSCVLVWGPGKSEMSTQVPFLSRLGIYRISIEKQETLIKLMVLSTCAILCKPNHTSSY